MLGLSYRSINIAENAVEMFYCRTFLCSCEDRRAVDLKHQFSSNVRENQESDAGKQSLSRGRCSPP